ncbi:MAG TPA: DDE transposase family protein [Synechococcales cyanobacterium M55_K2018_004]|nr:DDE transposase family protein [Synechococcales cyanobacterium M55_K2018_004]
MNQGQGWYVVRQASGHCEIVPAGRLPAVLENSADQEKREQWGPFETQAEAIARRVGLIRAGKCRPN